MSIFYIGEGKENEKRHGKKQIFSKIPMITNRNQALFAKMSSCGLQEEVLFFPNPAGQKSRVKAFTYKSSVQGNSGDWRLLTEMFINKKIRRSRL
jgi:hypothetical protein